MGKFDITFKGLTDRLQRPAVASFGHEPINETAVIEKLERELPIPLKSVDQAFLVEQDGRKWIEHFEAEVGLSGTDHRAIAERAELLRVSYKVPVWTTVILMSRRRSPLKPPPTFRISEGSLNATLRARYVKLWALPARG